MANRFLKIHSADNVLVALADLKTGERIHFKDKEITLVNDVPAKHKFAIQDLQPEDEIHMYGIVVGKAIKPIPAGGVIGTHNTKHKASSFHEKSKDYVWSPPDIAKFKSK